MPHAKLGPDPLKTVAQHKEQRDTQTDRHIWFYTYKIFSQ